ncbi:unnamed protein product [Symbiodinium natans]|uniref:NACHT domain-containing protein n=1 Tax=Symbiodinium natans TaxID=878477 RepID=A0A812LUT5_9DINO|nr:unnamed protein product [Symbiodinium natans]
MSRMTSRSHTVGSGAVKVNEILASLWSGSGRCLLLEGRPGSGRGMLARHLLARLAEGSGKPEEGPWLPIQASCDILASLITAGGDSSRADLLGQWLTEELGTPLCVGELQPHFFGVVLLLEGLERAGEHAADVARWAAQWLSEGGTAKAVLLTSRPTAPDSFLDQPWEEASCDLWGLAKATVAEVEWARAAAASIPDGSRLLQVQMDKVADVPCFLPVSGQTPSLAGIRASDQARMLEEPFLAAILLHVLAHGGRDLAELNCLSIYEALVETMWRSAGWTESGSSLSEPPESERAGCQKALQQLALDMCSRGQHLFLISDVPDCIASPVLRRVGGRHARFAHASLQSYFAALEILRRMDMVPQVLGQPQWPQVRLFLQRGLEGAVAGACRLPGLLSEEGTAWLQQCLRVASAVGADASLVAGSLTDAWEQVHASAHKDTGKGAQLCLRSWLPASLEACLQIGLFRNDCGKELHGSSLPLQGLLLSALALVGRVLRVGGGLQLSEQLLRAARSAISLEQRKQTMLSWQAADGASLEPMLRQLAHATLAGVPGLLWRPTAVAAGVAAA